MGLRMSEEDEILGSNLVYHDVENDDSSNHDATFNAPDRFIPPSVTKSSLRALFLHFKRCRKSSDGKNNGR